MSTKKEMAAEAKKLRALLDSSGLPAAEAEAERLQHRSEKTREGLSLGVITPELQEAHWKWNEACSRRDRIRSDNRDAADRLAVLDCMLQAPDRAESARAVLRDRKAAEQVLQRKATDTLAAVEKLHAMRRNEIAAAHASRARLAATVIAGLAGDLGEYADTAVIAPDTDAPAAAPEFHETRAKAIEEAIDRAEAAAREVDAALAVVHKAIEAASADLLTQLAYCAKLQHAEAHALYLPAFNEYRCAWLAAFSVMPDADRCEVDGEAAYLAAEEWRACVADVDAGKEGVLSRISKALPWRAA
ncbi:MAG: hypothetical protein H0W48_09075 [Methylibium sp.]|nr:hypothetical protein [Methylibium sp.]